MKRLVILTLFLVSCCPIVVGNPGDEGSTNWVHDNTSEEEPTIIDCQGKERGRLDVKKSNVIVRNCKINGDLRIWGVARNANSELLLEKSREKDYVTWLRSVSPHNVVIENVEIEATRAIPLYIGPGVVDTVVRNVKIYGTSVSTMIYLGAESYHTTIEDSEIDATNAAREAIAIDASDHNVIQNNNITYDKAGVYLYRNCGEGGVIRHTTPSYNRIISNIFAGGKIAVWVNSRNGNRCYCQDDAGFPLGSSQSDMDHGRYNVVTDNQLNGGEIKSS